MSRAHGRQLIAEVVSAFFSYQLAKGALSVGRRMYKKNFERTLDALVIFLAEADMEQYPGAVWFAAWRVAVARATDDAIKPPMRRLLKALDREFVHKSRRR